MYIALSIVSKSGIWKDVEESDTELGRRLETQELPSIENGKQLQIGDPGV
jgi:hypothetical protein